MTHLDLVGLKEECSTLRAFGNRSTALKRTLSVLCSTVCIHSYLVISQLFSLSLVILCHTLNTAVQSGCFYSKRSSEISEEQEGTVNKRHSCVLWFRPLFFKLIESSVLSVISFGVLWFVAFLRASLGISLSGGHIVSSMVP